MRNERRLLNRKDIEILREREEKRRKKRVGKETEEQEKTGLWFHDISEEERDEMWVWCMHCEECFQGKEALVYFDGGDKLFGCPNVWTGKDCIRVWGKENIQCDGSPIDWHSWESFREQTKELFGVEYSLIPEKGKTYPMYPEISEGKKEEIPEIRNYRGDFPNQELPG